MEMGCPGREIFKGGLKQRRADVPWGADGPLGGCSRRGHIRPENGTGAMNRRAGVALRLQQWPRTYLRGAMRG